jgi:O-antigen/teichoic acid export membrane protein
MTAFRKVVSGFSSVAVGMAVARAGVFLNLAMLARLLGAADLGRYATVAATISIFVNFSLFGIHAATAQMTTAYRARDDKRLGRLLFNVLSITGTLSIILALLVLAFVGPVAERFARTPGLAGLIALVVWNVPLIALIQVVNSALQGFEEFHPLTWGYVLSGVLLVSFSAGLAKLYGLRGALWGFGIANLLLLAFVFWLLVRALGRHGVRLEYRRGLWKEIFSFSAPLSVSGVAVIVAWWGTSLYLARTHGFTEVGYYSAGLMVFQLLQFLPGALIVPSLPVLTNRFTLQDAAGFRQTLDSVQRLLWVPSLAVVASVWFLAKPIAVHFLGPNFAPAADVLRWMGLAGLLSASCSIFGAALVSAGRVWMTFLFSMCWVLCFCGLAFALVPARGATGAALAACAAYLIMVAALWWYCASRFGSSVLRLALAAAAILLPSFWLAPLAREAGVAATLALGAGSVVTALVAAALLALSSGQRRDVLQWAQQSLRRLLTQSQPEEKSIVIGS